MQKYTSLLACLTKIIFKCPHNGIRNWRFVAVPMLNVTEFLWQPFIWSLWAHLIGYIFTNNNNSNNSSYNYTWICGTCHCCIHQFQSAKNVATPFSTGLITLHTETFGFMFCFTPLHSSIAPLLLTHIHTRAQSSHFACFGDNLLLPYESIGYRMKIE